MNYPMVHGVAETISDKANPDTFVADTATPHGSAPHDGALDTVIADTAVQRNGLQPRDASDAPVTEPDRFQIVKEFIDKYYKPDYPNSAKIVLDYLSPETTH